MKIKHILITVVLAALLAGGLLVTAQTESKTQPDPRIGKVLEQNEQILKNQEEIKKTLEEVRRDLLQLRRRSS
jgi:cell division protein FtsX